MVSRLFAVLGLCCACGSLVPNGTGDPNADDSGAASDDDGERFDLPGREPSDVVVATYNVHLLFDTKCDSGWCDGDDFESVPNEAQFIYRADRISGAIADLDTDVVLLQEIENQDCLDALSERLGAADYPTAVLGELGYAASVDTAVISRFETIEVRDHKGKPFARDFLEVHLDADGHRLIVFAAHFKSKYDDDPEQRLAEATRAREIVDASVAEFPDALVVMGGDLNDTPDSAPLRALAGEGGMLRVAAELAPEDWTYVYKDERSAIDHIYLATQASGGSYKAGSAVVFHGDGSKHGYGGSDHAALRASFRAGE